VASRQRLVVFNGLTLRALVLNDRRHFPEELSAFRLAFRGRRFRLLTTDGIIREYQSEAINPPQFMPLPKLTDLSETGRAIFLDQSQLNRSSVGMPGLPNEHRAFVLDAIAAAAEYLITNRQRWLAISEKVRESYGLQIVTPARFVELEG